MSGPLGAGDAVGPYRITRALGRGGMGTVYLAEDDLERAVALKVMRPELARNPEFRQLFTAEARSLARIDSPYVVKVYRSGEDGEHLYLAMQYVEGESLSDLLGRREPLGVREAAQVALLAAQGLGDIHEAGLLHRDIKPGNVLTRTSRRGLEVLICDFGIARVSDPDLTKSLEHVGTPAYEAPEASIDGTTSVASDLYSLGCVLVALVTGAAPYPGTTAVGLGLAHRSDPVPQLPGTDPDTVRLNAVLRRVMAKRPEDRYASADALATDLQRLLDGMPALDPPPAPDPPADPSPPRRRRRLLWPVVASVLVLAVLAWLGWRLGVGGTGGDGGTDRVAGSPLPSTEAPESGVSADGVRCWDGTAAAAAAQCRLPTGLAGLSSVFPSMDDTCRPGLRRPPKVVETWTCPQGDGEVAYSRWRRGVGRFAALDERTGEDGSRWLVDGEQVGRQWFWIDPGTFTYRWAAVYRERPYSVNVTAPDRDERERLIGTVEAVPPDEVGLALAGDG